MSLCLLGGPVDRSLPGPTPSVPAWQRSASVGDLNELPCVLGQFLAQQSVLLFAQRPAGHGLFGERRQDLGVDATEAAAIVLGGDVRCLLGCRLPLVQRQKRSHPGPAILRQKRPDALGGPLGGLRVHRTTSVVGGSASSWRTTSSTTSCSSGAASRHGPRSYSKTGMVIRMSLRRSGRSMYSLRIRPPAI